jgi:membrane-bound hydrogenase subunit beta
MMTSELTKENEIAQKLKAFIKEKLLEVHVPRSRRIFVLVEKSVLKKVVTHLTQKLGFVHLSTITGVDLGEEIEVIYHFSHDGALELSLRIRVPKNEPALPTITDITPGAVLYEREVHDILGVVFEGHPDLSRLILPEGWPNDVYPLRKEWTFEKVKERIMKRHGEKE